ncbi:MAG: NADH-quinone oxidoreductase subunit NuoF [Candidatus Scalindua sp.]|jgi:NADH:ubiquinone oxidoreductase subunit F (NADH-binding)/NAD-dependent dihydropyrimidine dehydrogenase PreA subunit/(2Fe-2S) ferredoxin|nr:NADH-quinone oxidoreductase subunit NuoF [Candidatus Scalindua sp.]MDV5165661.1 NADH-quinone oxidoreductase subunit NuoF [Candidatus Scalindua sp.]
MSGRTKTRKIRAKSSNNNGTSVISVCLGTGGIAAGGDKVFAVFEREIKKKKLDAAIGKRVCKTAKTGCRGLCAKDVLVDISIPETKTQTYERVTVDMVPQIVEDHLINSKPVEKWLAKSDYHNFHAHQERLVLGNCGVINPEEIDEYLIKGGYKALEKVLTGMTPQEVISEVSKSGLRGRGGGGFETGWKWESCAKFDDDEKYVVCNGDEGDPGAFMDRSIMEGDPHALLEGMVIGGYAIGATSGYIYVRAEYPLAIERLHIAIKQAKEKRYLGENILGSKYSLDIFIKEGAGAFVCGESTALQFSIEGKRGMPRTRPPQSVEAGLWNKPTCLNNVETFANVPIIINRGSAWFSKIGTEKSKGTKIFALTGNVKNTGLIEVPMGITVREIVFDIGGGVPKKKKFKAVQIGGPSGGCLPESYLDSPIDFESLKEAGAMMGSGSLVVVDETTCMVDMSRFFLEFCTSESCGKCPPCRVGTVLMLDILNRITQGEGKEEDIEVLEDMSEEVRVMSLCGLGQSAPNPVKSTLRHFRDEYLAHIRDKECPTASCVALHKYTVDPGKCTKCTLCIRNCPVDAISGSREEVAFIDKEKCIECNLCYDKCNFMAIK